MTSSLRRSLCLLCLLLAGLAARAQPAQPLQLIDQDGEVNAWEAATMLADPDCSWQLDDVLQRRSQFSAPVGPLSNLGVRRDVVWLHVPLQVPLSDSGRWLHSMPSRSAR